MPHEHIDLAELLENAVDPIDAVQVLRRRLGNAKTTLITLHISAWGLDILLGALEEVARRNAGEAKE